jgi:RNA polymerase sigma-70 factor (ECF subfamily)
MHSVLRGGVVERDGMISERINDPAESRSMEEILQVLVASGELDRALSILMSEYGGAVFARAYRILGDRHAAKDVLQETFLQVFIAISSFREQSTFKTWLLAIATYRALDAARRRRHEQQRTATDTCPAAIERSCADQVSVVDGTRSTRALEDCLRALSPEVRAAVLMRFQQDTTYEEMARVFGDRPATLHARVTRAIPVLRRCLRAKGIVP